MSTTTENRTHSVSIKSQQYYGVMVGMFKIVGGQKSIIQALHSIGYV